jgi:zinc transporter
MTDPILAAYALTGAHAQSRLGGADVARLIEAEDLAWVHLDATLPEAREWIESNLHYLDPHAIAALLAEETRPRATLIGDGALVILRGINLNPGEDPEDMVSIRVWVDARRIVSLSRRRLASVGEIAARFDAGRGPADTGAFLSLLVERLTEKIEAFLADLDEGCDALEEAIIATPDAGHRRPIIDARMSAIRFRRHIGPQRDAMDMLILGDPPFLDEMDRRRLLETLNRLTRIVEEVDAIRERLQIMKEDLQSALAERLNRNTYLLSIVAAVFLPLGFLTGLLGVNIGGIPGAKTPWAFAAFCAGLAAVVMAQVWLFRRLRWF